tara:strand:- start:71 stop:1000 length:930 start_codon:yes stop_codon:yes gene_type:complete
MKICFTTKPVQRPFGGGNQFLLNLIHYLKGHVICFDLSHDDIDLIFIMDPRITSINKINIAQVTSYQLKHPNVYIIHRVNECDIKRLHSINIEPHLLKAMTLANHVIFISSWLKNYFIQKYTLQLLSSEVILNGCNSMHFHPPLCKSPREQTIKLVTHHWSNNYLKGFHIYNAIDQLLDRRSNLEFTFIGNYHPSYRPKHIKLIRPKHGTDLGQLIQQHHIYVTASQNEPCGMHHIEGLSCGLPILYCSGGGGISEVCTHCGEEFNNMTTFISKLQMIWTHYDTYVSNIPYDFLSATRCCQAYLTSFNI